MRLCVLPSSSRFLSSSLAGCSTSIIQPKDICMSNMNSYNDELLTGIVVFRWELICLECYNYVDIIESDANIFRFMIITESTTGNWQRKLLAYILWSNATTYLSVEVQKSIILFRWMLNSMPCIRRVDISSLNPFSRFIRRMCLSYDSTIWCTNSRLLQFHPRWDGARGFEMTSIRYSGIDISLSLLIHHISLNQENIIIMRSVIQW